MTVYIVMAGAYESNHIEAVFSTREAADAYVREFNARCYVLGTAQDTNDAASVDEWEIDQPKVWLVGGYQARVYRTGELGSIEWDEDNDPNAPPRHEKPDQWSPEAALGFGPTREAARFNAERFIRESADARLAPHGDERVAADGGSDGD